MSHPSLNNLYLSVDDKNKAFMQNYNTVINNYNNVKNNSQNLLDNNERINNNKNVKIKVRKNEKFLQMQRQEDIKDQIDHESNIINICGIILVFICIMLVSFTKWNKMLILQKH